MLIGMARLHNSVKGSLAGRTFSRFLRFGVLRGLRSIEINPEDFRHQLANTHQLWVPDFARMKDVPTERLDAIAAALIRDSERLALAEGAREKHAREKLGAGRGGGLAAKIGAETAEKWASRLIPLASSAIGGALNFSFVRGWGRRVQRHLRAKHLAGKASAPPPSSAYGAVEATIH